MPPEKDPAAPADATAGTNPQPQNPGTGELARPRESGETTPPEQDADLRTPEGDAEEQPDGESAADAAVKTETEPKPKPKSRYQRRVEALVEETKGLQKQVEYFRGLADKQGRPKKLDPLDFNSDSDYQRALIQETARQTQTEFARTQAQAAAQQAAIVEQQIWDARAADYTSSGPDFDTVAYSDSVSYSKHGLQMVRQLPRGPQVAYYLGKNTAEAQRISQLPPLETAFELGRLEQRLSGPPRKIVSSTPKPVPTVRARGAATGFRPDSNDPDGYRKWRDSLPD